VNKKEAYQAKLCTEAISKFVPLCQITLGVVWETIQADSLIGRCACYSAKLNFFVLKMSLAMSL